jgi:integrase
MAEERQGKRRPRQKGSHRHPGVCLMQRTHKSGRKSWHARYKDPDNGDKITFTSMNGLKLKNDKQRRDWAEKLSKKILKARADRIAGIKAPDQSTLKEALDDYIERKDAELAKKTISIYQEGIDLFLQWAKKERVKKAAQLTPAHLVRFRAWLIARPSIRFPDRKRSPASVNRDMVSVRIALTDLRRLDVLNISRDRIRDALHDVKTPRKMPSVYREKEIRQLLRAALRHDVATFRMTRKEHDGKGEKGTTKRFTPIAPFVLTVLLSGARVGEIESLKWRSVDLDDRAIRIMAQKTGHERIVDLGVSPWLKELLVRMKLQAGDEEMVFPGWTRGLSAAALKRLVGGYEAGKFSWQGLRRTCSAFLACSPSIYGSASAYHAAQRAGHSVVIAERNYIGLLRNISPEHTTIEEAMGVTSEAKQIVESVGTSKKKTARTA